MIPFQSQADGRRAIYFVSFRERGYTVRTLIKGLLERGIYACHVPWDKVFASTHLPGGTWVLTDFERMDTSALMAAASIRSTLIKNGCRVLNDPGRWLPRADLLRVLLDEGINSYQCWRPAVGESPDRFPAFLRRSSGHAGGESTLLHSPEEAQAALDSALNRGLVLSDLLFIEFAAKPVPGTEHYRKHAAHCVGGHVIRAVSVNDTEWMVKEGVAGLASDADYAAELKEMSDYPHEAFIWSVCQRIGIEFGRVDFGERDGRLEVWEVNSNAMIYGIHTHPNPDREETVRLCFENLLEATAQLARSAEDLISIEECFQRQSVSVAGEDTITLLRSK